MSELVTAPFKESKISFSGDRKAPRWTPEQINVLCEQVEISFNAGKPRGEAIINASRFIGKSVAACEFKYTHSKDCVKHWKNLNKGVMQSAHKVAKAARKEVKSEQNLGMGQRLIQQLLGAGLEIGANASITITPTEMIIKF
jgi:hypothetical protein